MHEAGVAPVHEHFAINPSLSFCTPEDWKEIFIFAF
jgi:hypothetical protein